jgi:hypothetical protein
MEQPEGAWYTPTIYGGALNRSRSLFSVVGIILSAAILAVLLWATNGFAEKNVKGEGFAIQWIAIHSLLKNGSSPYSDQVSAQIQREVTHQNSFTGGVVHGYTTPLFSGVVVLPAAFIENKTTAHALWLASQFIAIFAIQLIGQKLTDWKPRWYQYLFFTLVTFFSYHVFVPWLDGGLSIWAAFFLILVFLSIRNQWNEIGGIFLALSAIQPQMTILVIIFTLFWASAHRKRILVLWFFMTLILLSILSVFLVPDWIMQYVRILFNYREYFPAGSLNALLLDQWPGIGKQLGWFVSIILAVLFILEARIALKKEFRHFLWTACLILVITQWIGIPMLPENLIVLLLPLILVAAALTERWKDGGPWIAVLLSLVLFSWEWALLYSDVTSAGPGTQLNLLIPLPLILLIGLYWVRWSVIRPRRMLLEELRSAENI